MSFKKGDYIYIGSAKGCLEARLQRHLKKEKRIFWHIDYLLKNEKVQISQMWMIPKSIECKTADVFNEEHTCETVKKGFGSSECKCVRHLFYIKNKEKTENILEKIGFSRIREFEF
ncbi:MAG: GIY-YIG nuclease family protein [Candidatus Atribacteria bacterium]|nr:GIY-YIG nuclease family protein [Candidatus Atribacteria bacterium]